MNQDFLSQIQKEFSRNASLEKKKNYEKYFKGVIKFYGLRNPEVKEIFQKFWGEIKNLSIHEQKNLTFELISSEYAEEKQFAILILNKIANKIDTNVIHELAKIIDHHVYDWATCDGISGRVIRHLILRDPNVAKEVVSWKDAESLWRQRSAAISFVNIARFGKYNQEILEICSEILKNPERFVQLAAGWVLRELSLADLDLVVDFIKKNYHYFSREGLRYAVEKMDGKLKKKLLDWKKFDAKSFLRGNIALEKNLTRAQKY
ncbi:DNA alkylation repair protein [Candidatus Peregrinibacteria bacterium]|nr:DNA alkylation repair protein [Candidatus Peregrinibacteria bacterium]